MENEEGKKGEMKEKERERRKESDQPANISNGYLIFGNSLFVRVYEFYINFLLKIK